MSPSIIPIQWQDYNKKQKQDLLQRPATLNIENISKIVSEVLIKVRQSGDVALQEFNIRFDRTQVHNLCVTLEESKLAGNYLNKTLKEAIEVALTNIKTFHYAQKPTSIDIETQPGVRCQQIYRPINSVGIYVPGGTASLFSTVLMLAIPASIAGCKRIVLCSPPPITNEILYVAQLCGIKEIFRVGGAQAIAALAFGTETIPKVDKIFGPGNAYVIEAKRQISQLFNAPAIDMPAGPSEVLIIADKYAIPSFIASDLLSQAEHGPDSQVILLTPSLQLANEVAAEIEIQLINLPRAIIVRKALKNSRLIVVSNLKQCVEISNYYGPEHLIIQTQKPRNLLDYITSASSIFLGDWSPESAGDYASGTNHVLPTYGYAANYSSLGLADFQKRILVQELTPSGLLNLAKVIESLANAEQLEAHKNAVNLRVAFLLKEKL